MMAYSENPVELGSNCKANHIALIFSRDLHGNVPSSSNHFWLQVCFVVLLLDINQYTYLNLQAEKNFTVNNLWINGNLLTGDKYL